MTVKAKKDSNAFERVRHPPMLAMNKIVRGALILSAVLCMMQISELSAQEKENVLRAEPHIVSQGYCRADADLFSVTLKLDIRVFNISRKPLYLSSAMTPWVAKVAKSPEEARAGNYLYEVSWSHDLAAFAVAHEIEVEPGKHVVLHSGYDLIARKDPTFDYPKSVPPGRYALVLILRPEQVDPKPDIQLANMLTTEPLVVQVPKHPALRSCK
jgi:hypothetical protein